MKPHKRIGTFLLRWHLIPKNRYFNIYLHKWIGSDMHRACHDHPWPSVAILLNRAHLYEITDDPEVAGWKSAARVKRFRPIFRSATHAHRMVLSGGPAWTLFITGRKVREWGYHCPKGWQHHLTISTEDGRIIGGCE